MKRRVYLIGIIFLFVFVWSAGLWAEDKVGFVNLKEILRDSGTGKKAIKNLKEFSEKEEKKIKSTEKDLLKIKDELDDEDNEMPASLRREKKFAFRKKLREYESQIRDADGELKRQDQEMTQQILPEIMKIVQSIAEKEKYTLILDIATKDYPYYDKEKDISKKVIEEFNKSRKIKP